jgi:hypothetical protein
MEPDEQCDPCPSSGSADGDSPGEESPLFFFYVCQPSIYIGLVQLGKSSQLEPKKLQLFRNNDSLINIALHNLFIQRNIVLNQE